MEHGTELHTTTNEEQKTNPHEHQDKTHRKIVRPVCTCKHNNITKVTTNV